MDTPGCGEAHLPVPGLHLSLGDLSRVNQTLLLFFSKGSVQSSGSQVMPSCESMLQTKPKPEVLEGTRSREATTSGANPATSPEFPSRWGRGLCWVVEGWLGVWGLGRAAVCRVSSHLLPSVPHLQPRCSLLRIPAVTPLPDPCSERFPLAREALIRRTRNSFDLSTANLPARSRELLPISKDPLC